MTLLHKPINLIPIAIIVVTAVSLAACTEKAADNTQAKKTVPPVAIVSGDRIAQWQREAQAGDPDAQYNLAYIYENGLGVPRDEAKALELYQQAADHGHSAAQSNLDVMNSAK